MAEIYYEALTSSGAATRGIFDLDSTEHAETQLAACELSPTIFTTAPSGATTEQTAAPQATEIRETLRALAVATMNRNLRREIQSFLTRREASPSAKSTFVGALLMHCQITGDSLTALGSLIELERDLRRVKSDGVGRIYYAYGLLIFASLLFGLTDQFVGSTFRVLFQELSVSLPSITLWMLQIGPFFWGLTIFLIAAPCVALLARTILSNQLPFDRGLDAVILWGPWRRWRYSAQAMAYLGSTLKSGLPLPEACVAAAEVLPRPFNKWQLQELGRRTTAGARLEAAFEAAKLHSMVIPFLLAAERQSNLAGGCMSAARLLLERCRRRRLFFAYFIESASMVFVLVTAIALFASYLLPVFSLIEALSR
jgi:type II secretory pathway component PulF